MPLGLAATQAFFVAFFFFFCPCCTSVTEGAGAQGGLRPLGRPLSPAGTALVPTLLLPRLRWDSLSLRVLPHQESKRSKRRGVILQPSCPSARYSAGEMRRQARAGAAPSLATARLHPAIPACPGIVQRPPLPGVRSAVFQAVCVQSGCPAHAEKCCKSGAIACLKGVLHSVLRAV